MCVGEDIKQIGLADKVVAWKLPASTIEKFGKRLFALIELFLYTLKFVDKATFIEQEAEPEASREEEEALESFQVDDVSILSSLEAISQISSRPLLNLSKSMVNTLPNGAASLSQGETEFFVPVT
jgi:hypothetical protein